MDLKPKSNRVVTLVAILFGFVLLGIVIRLWRTEVASSAGSRRPLRVSEEGYWIANARLRGLQPGDLELDGPGWGAGRILLRGHRVEPGDRSVLIWRAFDDNPEEVDEEEFEMLTIELVGLASGKTFTLPSDSARAFYSRGLMVWGWGDYSDSVKGEIDLLSWSPGGACEVNLRLDIAVADSHRRTHPVREVIRFEKRVRLGPQPFEGLTPWLRGTSPGPRALVPEER